MINQKEPNTKGPQCRLTAFNKNKVKEWKNALPFIKHVNKLFKHLTPKKMQNN